MLILNLKARIKNIHWWIGIISTIILIGNYFGFDITHYIGKDWQTLVGLIFGLLALLGVTVDTSTKGINDNIIQSATVQAINNQEQVKAEASTISINNTISENSQSVTFDKTGMTTTGGLKITSQDGISQLIVNDNSASSKIAVDNPENVIEDGKNVEVVSATSPTA